MRGIVKWFSDKRGYGFIECNDLDKDVYIHFSDIVMEGYKSLSRGDKVTFEYDVAKNKALKLLKIRTS